MKVLISDKMDACCVEILEKTPGVQVDVKTELSAAELETAIGDYPVDCVLMVRKLIEESNKWTSNTSLKEILNN